LFQAPKQRSKTIILAKNLPAKTSAAEIRKIFAKYGELGQVVMPPAGITGNHLFITCKKMSQNFVINLCLHRGIYRKCMLGLKLL
jgi:RNA recognition motif-containing protein